MKTLKLTHLLMISLIMILSVPLELYAQEDSAPGMAAVINVPGYVILSSGDTLYGKVRWSLKYVENNPVEIKFTAENGNAKIFNANEVRGFGNILKTWEENNPKAVYLPPEDYISIPSFKKGIPVFMNRLMGGRITVYQNRSSLIFKTTVTESKTRWDGIQFSFVSGRGLSIGPSYHTDYRVIESRTRFASYFVSKDGAPILKIEKDNYESAFNTLFGDCEGIKLEVEKNPDLKNFKRFMIIAEIYNQICKQE
jgi:hypothetical protein